MNERPIIFSGPMVRAILAGRKTQTRRAVKPMGRDDAFVLLGHDDGWWPYRSDDGESSVTDDGNETPHSCPYGCPGDRLWVRETWRVPGSVPRSDDPVRPGMRIEYRADCDAATDGFVWRPSIFMPRWASRLTLEVTGIRVERLQDISEADAQAEGMLCAPRGWCSDEGQPVSISARRAYEDLWYSIHGAWLDCWVWVVEFKKLNR